MSEVPHVTRNPQPSTLNPNPAGQQDGCDGSRAREPSSAARRGTHDQDTPVAGHRMLLVFVSARRAEGRGSTPNPKEVQDSVFGVQTFGVRNIGRV